MFRVIALSLVALFGLLALLDTDWTDSTPPARSAGLTPGVMPPAARATPQPSAPSLRAVYVADRQAGIFTAPAPNATVVRDLPQGEMLYLLGEHRDGFVAVRDASGQRGYVPVSHLSEQPV